MSDDYKLFGDKSFADLSKDIYTNSKLKKTQIDLLIQEAHSYINTVEDVVMIMPVIKELMDVAIKNDEHLVKLAGVIAVDETALELSVEMIVFVQAGELLIEVKLFAERAVHLLNIEQRFIDPSCAV